MLRCLWEERDLHPSCTGYGFLSLTKLFILRVMGILSACMCVYHLCAWYPWRSLELDLQTVVRHQWVLGVKPGSSGKAVSTVNSWAICLLLDVFVLSRVLMHIYTVDCTSFYIIWCIPVLGFTWIVKIKAHFWLRFNIVFLKNIAKSPISVIDTALHQPQKRHLCR